MFLKEIVMKLALAWLVGDWQWPKAALFCALVTVPFLAALSPFLPLAALLVCLQLPIYMIHQFEEHYQDRFRLDFNRTMGAGREVLTPMPTFLINSIFVWGVIFLSIFLMVFVNQGLGLIAVYLTLVNGLVHLLAGVIHRAYNPGLWTALMLFFPLGGYGWFLLRDSCPVSHGLGLGIAILIHAGIIVYVKTRLRKLKVAQA